MAIGSICWNDAAGVDTYGFNSKSPYSPIHHTPTANKPCCVPSSSRTAFKSLCDANACKSASAREIYIDVAFCTELFASRPAIVNVVINVSILQRSLGL